MLAGLFKIDCKKDIYNKFFMIFYLMFSLLLILLNLIKISFLEIVSLSIALIIVVFFCYLYRNNKFTINKYIFWILLIIPILIRISLFFFNYGNISNDYAFFFNSAYNYANNIALNNEYIAKFPYLYFYIFILGNFFKIFGSNYNTVIFLNLVFEILSAFFFYLIVRKKYNKETTFKSLLLYLYNPFIVFWVIKCCPVTIVNTFLMITIYMFINIDLNKKSFVAFSSLTGLFMGITNAFRPILIIFLIAIMIYYVYLIINKYNIKKIIISFFLIISLFILTNYLTLLKVRNDINNYESKIDSGYTLLVGSNIESNGTWNKEDSQIFNDLTDRLGLSLAEKVIKRMALERYKSNGVSNINLFANKAYVLGGNLNSYTFEEIDGTIMNDIQPLIKTIFKVYLSVFLYLILIINIIVAYKFAIDDNKLNEYKVLSIFTIGLFTSTLLVEVSARYFIPMLVPLIITNSKLLTFKKNTL